MPKPLYRRLRNVFFILLGTFSPWLFATEPQVIHEPSGAVRMITRISAHILGYDTFSGRAVLVLGVVLAVTLLVRATDTNWRFRTGGAALSAALIMGILVVDTLSRIFILGQGPHIGMALSFAGALLIYRDVRAGGDEEEVDS